MNAFGRYEIVRRIGVGGMGEVFFAWAYGVARTKKPVVVKVLRAEMLAEPGAPEMFVEEGRLSLRLSHSNVLQVFDFGKADDRYFMAMEYVDGYHLGELRKRAGCRLAPELAAFVAMEVCLALDYAHRLKDDVGQPLHIVHRDVTPSNVLVSREGEVKLADFGIARATGRSQHTQAGQIRGKVRYMSPEAARGEPLDHRADLFSLGAVLFEMLTGQRAFEGKGREAILQQVVGSRVAPPSSVEDVSPALDEVVVRATAPRREDRFPDAFAMHRALEAACRKAGLAPSRGAFLEFLRALDAADAAAEAAAPSSHESGRAVSARGQGTSVRGTPDVSPPAMTPAMTPGVAPAQAPASAGTAAVAPPSPSAVPAGAPVTRLTPSGSRPSSSAGSVPPPVKGPDTALPTGVASPLVLFTLTVAGEMTPSVGAAEVADLPRFEVTRGEGIAVDFRELERITPKVEQPGLPPVGRVSDEDEESPLFPDRPSLSTEDTVVREPTPAAQPASEPTIPPAMVATKSKPVFAVPVDLPLSEDTRPPIPREPANETTVPPIRASAPAAETEIRVRPALDAPTAAPLEPRPAARGAREADAADAGGSGSGSVSVSVSARRASRPAPSRAAAAPPLVESATSDSRDTIDHVEDAPRSEARTLDAMAPPPLDKIDASGRWRQRGELPAEPRGVDFPVPRPPAPSRAPLLAVAVVGVIVLGGWLGSQVLSRPGVDAAPSPKATPFGTPTIARATERETAPPATPAPVVSPAATMLAIATPPPATPTPAPVRTTPRATPTQAPTPIVRVTRTPVPATPTPAPPVAYGSVTLNSNPWSEVRLGGRLLGNTPLKNVRLPAGRHVFSLRNPVSGLARTVEVDVIANEERFVGVELK